METSDLRIALFSGNYNYTRDGANQALNRLVGSLLAKGAAVRVYSPKVANPDFAPTGDLVGLPNVPMPVKGRGEYRLPTGLGAEVKRDLETYLEKFSTAHKGMLRSKHWIEYGGDNGLWKDIDGVTPEDL